MLTEIYIEALLVDEELADQVWKAWDAGADFGRAGGGGVVGYSNWRANGARNIAKRRLELFTLQNACWYTVTSNQ